MKATHEVRASRGVRKRLLLVCGTVLTTVGLLLAVVLVLDPKDRVADVVMRLTEDTEYAPGYSESAFQGVDIGDTEANVRLALGEPLSETSAEPYLRWLYAPQPSPQFEADGSYSDLRFSYTSMGFGEDGSFTDAFGKLSQGSSEGLLGSTTSGSFGDGMNTLALTRAEIEELESERATVEDIRARFGPPDATFESHVVKWLYYSRTAESKNYRQRFIGIDGSGKVCRRRSRYYWD